MALTNRPRTAARYKKPPAHVEFVSLVFIQYQGISGIIMTRLKDAPMKTNLSLSTSDLNLTALRLVSKLNDYPRF